MKIIIKLSFTVLMTITMIFVSSAVEAGNSNISGFLNKLSGTECIQALVMLYLYNLF